METTLEKIDNKSESESEDDYKCPCQFCIDYRNKKRNESKQTTSELKIKNSDGYTYIKVPTIDIVSIQPWQSWCDADKCKVCLKGYFSLTFEVTYIENGEQHYYSEMCHSCLKNLVVRDPDSYTDKKRRPLLEKYDLI